MTSGPEIRIPVMSLLAVCYLSLTDTASGCLVIGCRFRCACNRFIGSLVSAVGLDAPVTALLAV